MDLARIDFAEHLEALGSLFDQNAEKRHEAEKPPGITVAQRLPPFSAPPGSAFTRRRRAAEFC